MNYLRCFSDHHIALLSDWLAENNELFIDFHYPHSGGSGTHDFARSIAELKRLIADQTHREVAIIIFRELQFPLRGLADAEFLAKAQQLIPNGRYYFTFRLSDMQPAGCGETHHEMLLDFEDSAGIEIAVGEHPLDYHSDKEYIDNPARAFYLYMNQAGVTRSNQEIYTPYLLNPEKYQAVLELWHEPLND